MRKRTGRFRRNSGRRKALLAAGGALLCLVPVAQALEVESLSLRLSQGMDAVPGPAPRFREDAGPDIALSSSPGVSMGPSGAQATYQFPAPVPSRSPEYPLRLAQVMLPQIPNGRQPRWSSRYDYGLDLQPSQRLNMPGAPANMGGMPMPGVQTGEAPYPAMPPMGETPTAMVPGDSPAGKWATPAPRNDPPLPSPEGEESGGGLMSWRIPPIRWGGSINYNVRQSSSDDKSRSLDQILNANVRGASYIYAPWLAAVQGSLGFVTGAGSVSGPSGDTTQSRNNSLVGSGNLDLFPASRFPFSANFSRSDSRTQSQALFSDYTDTRFGVRQSYRSEDGLHSASGGFDYSVMSGRNGLSDSVAAVHGSYNAPIGGVTNSISARASMSQRQGTGEGSQLFSINSTHSYNPEENISLQAYSNFTDNTLRAVNGGSGISEFRGQFWQMGTSASWRPEFEDNDDQPLNISGGINYSGARAGSGNSTTDTQRISATTAAYYRFSPNLSLNGSGTLNYFSSGTGQTQMLTLMNSSVTYNGDPLKLGNFSYNWNTGGNVSWQSASGNSPSNIFTSAQAGHSLGRSYVISNTDAVSMSFSQTASVYQNQMVGSSAMLSHNAMTSYRLGLGEQFNGSVTGTFSDNLTSGINAQHFDSLSLGFNGGGQLNARSSASVNLMFNWSDQTQKTTFDTSGQQTNNTQRMTMSGNASYTHVRFATIPGLRYTLLFVADTLLRDNRLMGDPNAQAQRYRYSVDNRLDYRIGLLDFRASATVNEQGGKKNALLFFQVTRQIGSY